MANNDFQLNKKFHFKKIESEKQIYIYLLCRKKGEEEEENDEEKEQFKG